MGIVDFLSNGLKAVAGYFGWASKRSDLNNTPEMQQNARAQTDATAKAKATTDVDNPNPTDFEKGIS